MKTKDRFEGCILGGAIGDALGSAYENQAPTKSDAQLFYPFGKPVPLPLPRWRITDDTQLTLATCEAITEMKSVNLQAIAQKFLEYYQARKITGVGASTLKSLQELDMGGHWSQVGRKGEYAAGNGAAMRIAPLAFASDQLNRKEVEEVSRLTHHNDEAYAGALSVVMSLHCIIQEKWTGTEDLLGMVAAQLPDTRVKDRLAEISKFEKGATIQVIGNQFGSSGYVVESIPLALFAASKSTELGFERMLEELVAAGGDTDTNGSIAGQIAGALIGKVGIPPKLLDKLMALSDYNWIRGVTGKFIQMKN